MSMVIWMLGLPIIFNLHDGATIVPISMVDHMLYPTIRKVDMVLPLNVTSLITRPHFTKVCVILVIMHSILEVERIRFLIIMLTTMTTTMASTYTSTNSSRSRKAESLTSY
jgi:hypothetical protein